MKLRILTEADCRSLLTMEEAIAVQGKAFRMLADGESVQGLRSYAISENPPGVAIFNPCFLKGARGYGVKVVSDFYNNREPEVPRMTATMTLMDGTTGVPHTFMEAGYLTDLRTGAGTGFAATMLARPDTDVLAVIGAGRVARYQISALVAALPIKSIRISTRTRARGEELVRTVQSEVAASVELVDSPADAIRGAGAVVAATTSKSPVFEGKLLEPGAFVVSAGSYRPDTRELDTQTIRRAARCAIDSRADCLADAGEYQIPAAEGVISLSEVIDIGDLAIGKVAGRLHDDDITVYKSMGVPIQDIVTGQEIADRAGQRGVGVMMELNP